MQLSSLKEYLDNTTSNTLPSRTRVAPAVLRQVDVHIQPDSGALLPQP